MYQEIQEVAARTKVKVVKIVAIGGGMAVMTATGGQTGLKMEMAAIGGGRIMIAMETGTRETVVTGGKTIKEMMTREEIKTKT